MPTTSNPIICALDTADINQAKTWAETLCEEVGMFKLGLEFFLSNGPDGVRQIASYGKPIFLDLKLHDIPNTVSRAVRTLVALDVSILTIHTLGGHQMLRDAALAVKEESERLGKVKPLLAGVTMLTSMEESELPMIGINQKLPEQVMNLAILADACNLDAIVCSPHEVAAIKRNFGHKLKIIVPGIRAVNTGQDDQKRVMSPREAIDEGADYLVIGRPITGAPDPKTRARAILSSLS